MHGIATKIAQEVAVLFEHQGLDAGACEQQAQNHPGRSAADDAAACADRVRIGHDPSMRAQRCSVNTGAARSAKHFACLAQIGRAHVWTPVTNTHLVCSLLLEKKTQITKTPY